MGFSHTFNLLSRIPVAIVFALLQSAIVVIKKISLKQFLTKNKYEKSRTVISPPDYADKAYGSHGFLEINGVQLHYVECGDKSKPLLLLVHGFPEFWYSWRHQIRHFSKSYWVVAVDLRGYGESGKPSGIANYSLDVLSNDIYEFVTKGLNRKSCILVGNDWGAAICYKVAADHPEIVDKLIALNGTHPTAIQKRFCSSLIQLWKSWYWILVVLPWLPEMILSNQKEDVFSTLFRDSIKMPFVTKKDLDAYKFTFSDKESWTSPINYFRAAILPLALFREIKFKKITTPTLLLWGDDTFAFDRQLVEMTKDHFDDVTVRHVPGGNHYLQQHKPSRVHFWMDNFLSSGSE